MLTQLLRQGSRNCPIAIKLPCKERPFSSPLHRGKAENNSGISSWDYKTVLSYHSFWAHNAKVIRRRVEHSFPTAYSASALRSSTTHSAPTLPPRDSMHL